MLMNRSWRFRSQAALAAMLLLASTGRAADPPMTVAQLRQLADAKSWQDLLKAATYALSVKGPDAQGVERVPVTMLKGEAQLQTQLFEAAALTFEAAAKEPSATPEQIDTGLGLAQLMRKCTKRGYAPAPTKDEPTPPAFDIFNPETRPAAMTKLLEIQLGDCNKQFDSIKETFPPAKTLSLLGDLKSSRHLERAGAKSDDRALALQTKVSESVGERAKKWADKSLKRVDQIRASANAWDRVAGTNMREQRGMSGQQGLELKAIMKDAEAMAEVYTRITDALPEDAREPLAEPKQQVQKAYDESRKLYKQHFKDKNLDAK